VPDVSDPGEHLAGVRPGDVLAGKYRVERVLGRGGMGVVVAAHHIQLEEKVALKFLLPEALGNAEAVGRFIREARAAVRIKSEHVARVSDVGTLPDGAPYMVMEYLEGGDLAAWLQQRGPLPLEQAVEFVLQACVAVADAHALGIVHRDLKPANLFCVRRTDGQLSIKVLDFGISKLTDASGPGMAMTKTSALMGSPLYMSPEQMRSSRDVDPRADIWALGIILFELMTGRATFLAESVTELAIKVAAEPPPPLRSFRPDAPPGLEAVILKCLEKDRAARYRNVGELALALLPFAPKRAKASVERISGIIQAAGLSASALSVPSSPPVAHMEATAVSGGSLSIGRTTTGVSRSKASTIGGGVVALVVAGAAATFFLMSRKPLEKQEAQAAAGAPALLAPSTVPGPAVAPVVAPVAPVVEPTPVAAAKTAEPPPAPVTPGHSPAASPPRSMEPVAHRSLPAATPAPAAPAAAPAPAPKAAPNCDPPYYFDARGNRAFKPECI
jgi:serine/threonine protein kinase